MNIPRDTIIHAAGGLVVAVGCAALAWVELHYGLAPLSVAVLSGGLAGAGSVEFAQWHANRTAMAAGQPTRHDVSFLDFLASFAPAVAIAAVIQLLA